MQSVIPAAAKRTAGSAVVAALTRHVGATSVVNLAPWVHLTFIAQLLGQALAEQLLSSARSTQQHPPRLRPPRLRPNAAPASVAPAAAAPQLPARRGRRSALLCTAAAAASAASPGRLSAKLASAAAAAAAAGVNFASVGVAVAGGLLITGAAKAVRRWHASRRASRRTAPLAAGGASASPAREVTVVTFNIRAVMDRWPERKPLLSRCLKDLDADVYCFQEVLTGEFQQEKQLLGDGYVIYPCRAALEALSASGGLPSAYAALSRALLSFPPTRGLLVAAPTTIESWRERRRLAGAWARVLRDATIAPFYGNSIASRLGRAGGQGVGGVGGAAPETLLLGAFRAAQRVCLEVAPSGLGSSISSIGSSSSSSSSSSDSSSSSSGGGGSEPGVEGEGEAALLVWLVNTHLDHACPDKREQQVQAIIDWMEPAREGCAGVVITGDLNAPPGESTHTALHKAGYFSASKVANGREPRVTWPSGLVAPLMDEGEPHCADYIYVWESPGYEMRVTAARVAGDVPAAEDPTLFPSDHFALHVRLAAARRAPAAKRSSSSISSGSSRFAAAVAS